MQRKITIVLAIMVLNYSINALADTDSINNNTQEESAMILTEIAPQTEKTDSEILENSPLSEKEDSSEQEEESQETSSQEEQRESSTQENSKTSGEVVEETDTKESMQKSEEKDSEISAEETLPVSVENQPEESDKIQSEKILENNKETLVEQHERKVISSEDDIIYNVSFPTNIHAYLDPGDLSGNGQIFSKHYEVENFGNTDVAIKIKSIQIYYRAEEGNYEFSEEKITDSLPRVKKINVDMVWEKDGGVNQKILHVTEDVSDEYVIELKANGNEDNSIGYFYFIGTMNPNPNINWEDGDLSVTFYYEIIGLADVEEEILIDEDGSESDTELPAIETEEAKTKNEKTENKEIDNMAGANNIESRENESNKEETEETELEEKETQTAEEKQNEKTEPEETVQDAADDGEKINIDV